MTRYRVRVNNRSQRTMIHRESCRYFSSLRGPYSQWYGPYETLPTPRPRPKSSPADRAGVGSASQLERTEGA